MKVLIVSEHPPERAWVRSALGPAWAVEEASNGREALVAIEAGTEIDLVVADQTTGPFGAFGLSREVKQLIDPPSIIVLLERDRDSWLARWSGADRWFVRPVNAFELADAAKELVTPVPVLRRKM